MTSIVGPTWRLFTSVIICSLMAVAGAPAAEKPSASIAFDAEFKFEDIRYFVILVQSPAAEDAAETLTPESLSDVVRRAESSNKPVAVHFLGHTPTLAELSLLKPLTKLSSLSCAPADFKDEAMEALASLRTLRHLGLARMDVTEAGFAKLMSLAELRTLGITTREPTSSHDGSWTNVSSSQLAQLGKLTKLRSLQVAAPLDDAAIEQLGKLAALEELVLDGTFESKTGLANLSGCRALKSLSIDKNLWGRRFDDRTDFETDWSFLRTLPNLESLSFGVTRYTERSRFKLSQSGPMREIAECKQLRKLKWHLPAVVCLERLSDDDITRLGSVETLKEIDFCATPIYADQVNRLKLLRPGIKVESPATTKRPAVDIQ